MKKSIRFGLSAIVTLLVIFFIFAISLPHFIDINTYKPQIINAVKNSTGRDFAINGTLSWSFFPELNIEATQVELANPPGFSNQPFAAIDELKFSVEIFPLLFNKEIILHELSLNSATLHLNTLANGDNNWESLFKSAANAESSGSSTSSPTNDKKSSSVNFNVDTFELSNSTLTWDDQQKDQHWNFTQVNVDTDSFAFGKPFSLKLKSTIQHPPASDIFHLTIDTTALLDPNNDHYVLQDLIVSGTTQSDVNAATQPIHVTLDKLDINSQSKLIALQKLVFDGFGSHATGELNVKNDGKYPEVKGGFNIDHLSIGKLTISQINLPVTGQQGHYALQPFSSVLYSGSLTGNLALNATGNTPQWQVNYQLDNLKTQDFFQQAFGYDRFTGTGKGQGQFSASGLDADALLRTLSGNAQTQLNNGSLEGIDLGYWWQVGNDLLNANPSALGLQNQKRTTIANLSADFNFTNGVGSTNNLVLYNDAIYVTGKGTVDLVRRYVNMTLYVSSNKNGQPSGTAIPLLLSGDFSNITVKPDEKTIAAMATKVLSSKLGQEATKAITKNVPSTLQQPLNNAVNKLLGK